MLEVKPMAVPKLDFHTPGRSGAALSAAQFGIVDNRIVCKDDERGK
jgi:hypothetical protein